MRDVDVDDFERIYIDGRPDVDLIVFDVDFRFVDSHRRVVVGLGIKQVRQPLIQLAHSLVGGLTTRSTRRYDKLA